MVQMIGALYAVLLHSRQTELASPAYATDKSDTNESPDFQVSPASWAQFDNPPNAFVSADMGQFDVCDGLAISTACGTVLCMEVC